MEVKLMSNTRLNICARAIRTCHNTHDKSDSADEIIGDRDLSLIEKVGVQYRHESVLEHLVYTFYISGISRACLQELARHRMASLSVKSTRYTLKELKDELPFTYDSIDRAKKYIVLTKNEIIDRASIDALENLRKAIVSGVKLDIAKYCLPESYKTELTWTINARSLRNFIKLRSADNALWEIRLLAYEIFMKIPDGHKFIYSEYIDVVKLENLKEDYNRDL